MGEDRRGSERLAELFERALALPQQDRQRYAADTCRDDPALCAELVSLLTAYEEAPDYLEHMAPRLQPAVLTPTESFTTSLESDRGVENEMRLRVGQRLGHYEIGRLLSRGGMSEVWEAEDLDTGRHVALKALEWRLDGALDHARFLREGRLAARVNHPNIVYVFGTEEIDGVPVIAMELAGGGTLKDLVTADGPMRPARAVGVMLQVIAGLEAAAAAGVLHRDIKPSNCFVDAEGRIQVGDFGIAVATAVQPEATLTRTGGLLCTPTFASPEQLRGAPLDVRSDIYAVGGTLYYLLTGRPPFDEEHVVRLIERVLNERPPAVGAVRRDVPRTLDKIVQQCLAKDPAERPPSYAHLSRLLLPYRSASPIPAPLGLRAFAFLLDGMFVRGAVLPFYILAQQLFVLASSIELLAPSALFFAYFGVTEGLWGASPGKLIVGLRVVGTGPQPLGVRRLLARSFLWLLVLAPLTAVGPTRIAGLPYYLDLLTQTAAIFTGLVILFSGARRTNGFAGLHDLATDTRVVLKLQVESPSASPSPPSASPVLPAAPTRLGPYVLLDETAAPGVAVGFDQQLARRVWIHHAPAGTPAASLARRSVSRPTRLRWLTGSRGTDGGWDAYEAAEGEPLRKAMQQPRTWATVRGWLQDLAQEMLTAGEDETGLPLSIDRVWVTNARARLLDWLPDGVEGAPASSEFNSLDVRHAQHFLYDVAMRGLSVQQPGLNRAVDLVGVPLHARELLDELASERFDTTAAIVERLRLLATKPLTFTRARRCAHLAICGAAPLGVMVIIPALVVSLSLQSPDVALLDRLPDWGLMLGIVLLQIVFSAVPALLSTVIARGGALFRVLGIAVVGPDGYEVSRLRGVARSLIAWTPAIASLALIWPFPTRESIQEVPVEQLAPSLVLLAVFVAGAVFALINPNRGLQDRIIRTSLVAR
jgi:hypothetical protein